MSFRISGTGSQRYLATTGLPGGTFTFTCWAMIVTDRNANSCVLRIVGANSVWLETDTDGTTIKVWDTTGSTVRMTGPNMTVGTWYKLALVSSGSNSASLYYAASGAALTKVDAVTWTPPSTITEIDIGSSDSGNEPLNGRIAAVKMWTSALTQTQVDAELDQFNPVITANLQRVHPFHVPDLADYSGNANTLTGGAGTLAEADPPTGGALALPLWVADRGTTANVTAGSTQSHTIGSPTSIAVGNYLIARVAVDNTGSSGAATTLSITDPRSNTWTVLGPGNADPGAAAAGSTAYLAYARVGTAYQAADALTFNWGNSSTAKAIVVEEWTGIHATNPVAVSAVTNDSGTAGSTTAVSATIAPIGEYQLVYTCLSTEGIAGDSITYDTDTTSGLWATLTRVASADATATNNQCVAGQHKVVTAAGSQTWNATITSRDWAAVAVVFNSAAAAPPFRPVTRRLNIGALLDL